MVFKWQPSFHIKSNRGFLRIRLIKTLLEAFILFMIGLVITGSISLFSPAHFKEIVPPEAIDPEKFTLGVVLLFIFAITIAPFFEELILRFIPQLIINKIVLRFLSPQKRNLAFWSVGILTSLLFAWGHTSGYLLGIQFSQVPASQFISGIYFWSLLRKRGFLHLVLAHAFLNFLVFASISILFTFHSIFEFLK